jgi:hypothetical protein
MVYRPSDYAFPRSRGRRGFEIRTDGTFIRHGIGPADGPEEVRGRWRAGAPDHIAVEYEGRRGGEELVIVSCEPKLLRLRRG